MATFGVGENPYNLDRYGAVGRETLKRRGQDISVWVSTVKSYSVDTHENVTFSVDACGTLRVYDLSGTLRTTYSPRGWLRVNVEAD